MNIASLQQLFSTWFALFASDPIVQTMQLSMMAFGLLMICIVFFTTRDVLLRSNSFFFMLFAILLVTALPIIGLLLYLLIRPSRTVSQRRTDATVMEVSEKISELEAMLLAIKKSSVSARTKKTRATTTRKK